jgi:hypothetical protein
MSFIAFVHESLFQKIGRKSIYPCRVIIDRGETLIVSWGADLFEAQVTNEPDGEYSTLMREVKADHKHGKYEYCTPECVVQEQES